MRFSAILIDPFSLSSRGEYASLLPGGRVVWDSGSDTMVSGEIPFWGQLPDRGSMIRIMMTDDRGREQALGTFFWQSRDERLASDVHHGTIELLSPLVALSGAVAPTSYTIGAGCRAQSVIADVCRMALRPVLLDTALGDYRYREPVTYAAGTSLLKIAAEAGALAGLTMSVDIEGRIMPVDADHVTSWAWSDLPGASQLVAPIEKASARFDTPNRVVATSSSAGDETLAASAELRWSEVSAMQLGRYIDQVITTAAAGGRYATLQAIAQQELDSASVSEEWTLATLGDTTCRPYDRATVASYEGDIISHLRGRIARVEIALDALASTSIIVRGTIS